MNSTARTYPVRHSTEAKWFFWAISLTFPAYFLGALYLIAPILGWLVVIALFQRWIFEPHRVNFQVNASIKFVWSLWLIGALGLLFALLIGHANFDLGLGKTVKSTIGWAKGWALITIFITLGLFSEVSKETIIRAACIVGTCALVITPLLVVAYLVGAPGELYVSPLKVLGGSGPEFFTVILYEIDPGNGRPRWRYFAPWAPAVGLVANVYLMCCFFEKDKRWKLMGILGNCLMILLSVSRMGLAVLLVIPLLVFFSSRIGRVSTWIILVVCIIISLIFAQTLISGAEQVFEQLKTARADSTRVRMALNEAAVSRWQNEAFWFGHGVVERGSHYVEFMPIGSHHNWYGLLFVKGIVGFFSFSLPFFITGVVLLFGANTLASCKLALGHFFILTCFSLSENIEALAYMTWPAWLMIGIALRELFERENNTTGGSSHV